MEGVISTISGFFEIQTMDSAFWTYYIYISRILLALTAIIIIFRAGSSMLRHRYEPEVWGYVDLPNGARVPLRNWECTIGSSKSCDIVVNDPSVAPTQMVLIRDERGNWAIYDIASTDENSVNGLMISRDGAQFSDGDSLEIGKTELRFFNLTEQERNIISKRRSSPGKLVSPSFMFILISFFQFILMTQQLYFAAPEHKGAIGLGFFALFITMWLYYIIIRAIGRSGFEVEVIAFFLSSIGLSIAASSTPEGMLKQIAMILAGIAVFLVLGFWLRDLRRVKALRWIAALGAVGLLAVNLVFGTEKFGAINWISIGGFMFQPSEFVKIAYIYAGAATMDRLYRGRNLLMYIAFSAICVGALAIMGDFGSALVFFATFLVISFMRSGNIGTVILAVSGAGFAGFLALNIKPHIAQRFAAWGHVWEDVNNAGFQQTRAMSAAASGGFFGRGAGNGWLHKIVAADTDLVFGMTSEELGLIVGVCAIAGIILLAAFVLKNAAQGRSSFYVIAGTAAVSMMMLQLGLNVFGSLDILPFTGVTFPFVSLGGSSLISCWGLLAFVKATDTRKNASFVVRAPNKMYDDNEFSEQETIDMKDTRVQQPFVEDISDECTKNGRNLFDRRGERRGRDK